jgi:DinB superfamily
MEHLKYPIGKFNFIDHKDNYGTWVHTINEFPSLLQQQITTMTDVQLEKTYRPQGWTGRQVIHHLADSHMQALSRFKWSLTESAPTIKTYKEELFADLPDYSLPIESAILILNGVHQKWSNIMSNLTPTQWQREYHHPDLDKYFTLREASALYAWHCMHHLGHLSIIANQ